MSRKTEKNIATYSVYSQYAQSDILSYKKRSAMLKRVILSRCENINTFAKLIGKKRETVEKWIFGYTYQNYPNRDDILAICFLLEIPVDNFMKFFPKYSYYEWQEKIKTRSEDLHLFHLLFCNDIEDVKELFSVEKITSLFFEYDRYLIFSDLSKVIQLIGDEIDLFYFCQRLNQSESYQYSDIIKREIRIKEKSESFQWENDSYDECRKNLLLVNSLLYFWNYWSQMEGKIREDRIPESKKYFRTKDASWESLLDKKKTGQCIKKAIYYQFNGEEEFSEITNYCESTVKKWILAQSMPTRWEWEDLRRIFDLPLCNLMRFSHESMIDLALEDVCVLVPFVDLKGFWYISIAANKPYLFHYLRDEVIEKVKDTPAGRYALRKLKRRICPLVDDIHIEPYFWDEKEAFQEWEAYNNAWTYKGVEIWLSSEETLKELGFIAV